MKNKKLFMLVLLLVVVLAVACAYAYLNYKSTLNNNMQIGIVKVELWETMDANGDGIAETYNAGTKSVSTINVAAGQILKNSPSIHNTGSSSVYGFLALGIQTSPEDTVYTTEQTSAKVDYRVFGIQSDISGVNDVTGAYSELFNEAGLENEFGSKVTNTEIPLAVVNNAVTLSTKWTALDSFRTSGTQWTIYGYNDVIDAGNQTSYDAFSSVVLSPDVFEKTRANITITQNGFKVKEVSILIPVCYELNSDDITTVVTDCGYINPEVTSSNTNVFVQPFTTYNFTVSANVPSSIPTGKGLVNMTVSVEGSSTGETVSMLLDSGDKLTSAMAYAVVNSNGYTASSFSGQTLPLTIEDGKSYSLNVDCNNE